MLAKGTDLNRGLAGRANNEPKTERIPLKKRDFLTFCDTVEVEAIDSCQANWAQIEGYS
jgi:hypothetical protein